MSLWWPELEMGPQTPVGNAARVRSKHLRNSFPCPQPDGRSIVTFRQTLCEGEGVSPFTVSAAIRIRTNNLGWREAADLRLRPRGYWDLLLKLVTGTNL